MKFRSLLEQSRIRHIYREYEAMGHVFILYPIREAGQAFRDLLGDLAQLERGEDR